LASAFNSDSGSPVTAVASGSVVTVTSKTTGPTTDYSLSSSSTTNYLADFGAPSFYTSQSGSALTGGSNAVYTTRYDSGTSSITVNGHSDTVSWSGTGTTASSIASSLTSTINADSSASVTASVSGTVVSLTAKTTGASTDYTLSSSYTYDSTDFSSSSFTSSNSGSALTGGANAGTTVYDSGTVWVTVNGVQVSVSYGQGSTSSTVASAIANGFNTTSGSPVTASVSGSLITLTAGVGGSATDYSLSAGSSTSYPSRFSSPSFPVSTSGASLTGGSGPIYSVSLAYAPDASVISANDSVNGNWNYQYDQLNRLVCSNLVSNGTCSSPSNGTPTYAYIYDRFGNRWQQNGPLTMLLSFTGNATTNNNRMDLMGRYAYDSAGNVTNDGVHSYTYDAENRLISVDGGATASYIYDADDHRVRKTTAGVSVDYLYDLGGNQITELSSTGSWNRGELYAGGKHVATYNYGTTYFIHSDWLGTERARTTVSASVYETCASLPFGDGLSCSGGDPSPLHFTGKQRDLESGLDDFGARYGASNFGRFITPDWSATAVDVPYADFANPQSLNLYGYVKNNPITLGDSDGHCPDGICQNISQMSPAAVKQQAQDTKDVFTGFFQKAANVVISTVNSLLLSGDGGAVPSGFEIDEIKPANEAQATGQTAGGLGIAAVGVLDMTVTGLDGLAGMRAEAAVPDANVVVRGGAGEMPPQGTTFSGAHGATVEDAAQGVPHGQIRTSTAGDIREGGGSVRSAPERTRGGNMNNKHVNVREGSKKPSTFSKPKPNPVPKKDRVE
jgi:RHS repeat-associated protein